MGKSVERLREESEPRLRKLLHDLDLYRSPLASDAKHKVYRSWPERWLESIVLEEPAKIDALLDPEHFYSQVPALAAPARRRFSTPRIFRRDADRYAAAAGLAGRAGLAVSFGHGNFAENIYRRKYKSPASA